MPTPELLSPLLTLTLTVTPRVCTSREYGAWAMCTALPLPSMTKPGMPYAAVASGSIAPVGHPENGSLKSSSWTIAPLSAVSWGGWTWAATGGGGAWGLSRTAVGAAADRRVGPPDGRAAPAAERGFPSGWRRAARSSQPRVARCAWRCHAPRPEQRAVPSEERPGAVAVSRPAQPSRRHRRLAGTRPHGPWARRH